MLAVVGMLVVGCSSTNDATLSQDASSTSIVATQTPSSANTPPTTPSALASRANSGAANAPSSKENLIPPCDLLSDKALQVLGKTRGELFERHKDKILRGCEPRSGGFAIQAFFDSGCSEIGGFDRTVPEVKLGGSELPAGIQRGSIFGISDKHVYVCTSADSKGYLVRLYSEKLSAENAKVVFKELGTRTAALYQKYYS